MGSDARTADEQLAKAELRGIGIQLTERPLPANVIFGPNGLASGDFDIAQLAVFVSDPGDWAAQYSCRGVANWTGFCSTKVDALFKAGTGELVPAKRIADYQAVETLLSAEAPAFPLFRPIVVWVHRSDLLGTVGPGGGAPVEYWHWKS